MSDSVPYTNRDRAISVEPDAGLVPLGIVTAGCGLGAVFLKGILTLAGGTAAGAGVGILVGAYFGKRIMNGQIARDQKGIAEGAPCVNIEYKGHTASCVIVEENKRHYRLRTENGLADMITLSYDPSHNPNLHFSIEFENGRVDPYDWSAERRYSGGMYGMRIAKAFGDVEGIEADALQRDDTLIGRIRMHTPLLPESDLETFSKAASRLLSITAQLREEAA